MKKLSEAYEGIKFFTRDEEENKYFGVAEKNIEKEINLVGLVTIGKGEEFSPDEWSTNDEDFYVDEETFGEYEYVLTESDVKDIIMAYEKELEAIDVESYFDFMQLEELPLEIHEGVLMMLKEKNSKDHLSNFFEEVYNFYDGRNYRKISLQDGNGYYEADLDYNVSEPIEDGYGSGYFKYFFTDTATILKEEVEYNTYEGHVDSFFTIVSIVEEEDREEIIKDLHNLVENDEGIDEETKEFYMKEWVKVWKKFRLKELF
ncbi:hypothetical protein [Bacillus mycoides]|uniref:Uncharacterized protein n=1 Tax=Bacillus mycoides TaxID=1405 RepID=A0A1E8AXZ2_BACMY|nr:hypothetical protein [Bacillus mycoides]OFD69836.1 hypothetical protein BWGOE8_59110 [Bacillus mycoides]OFD70244.1 hypothetical protein BWGOE9_56950 [Bacillus mycoides]OFD70311.1 hypothetical protein BWGOE10_59020 [Bacillus mycoides]